MVAVTTALDPGCVKTLGCCYDSPVILSGESMRRFVEEADRGQRTPECLDDFVDENNPVRAIESLSMRLIWPRCALVELRRRRRAGRPITPRFS